jgi:uncharacterized OB-fold protein
MLNFASASTCSVSGGHAVAAAVSARSGVVAAFGPSPPSSSEPQPAAASARAQSRGTERRTGRSYRPCAAVDAPSPLHFQRCGGCAAALHPPRPVCPVCGSRDLAFEESAGLGTVYTTSDVHTREETFNVSLVDLDEGYRVMSTVEVGVAIGSRVRGREDDDGRLVFDVEES